MSTALKECPFCGNTDCSITAHVHVQSGKKHYEIHCSNCGRFADYNSTSEEESIDKWNKRYTGSNTAAGIVYEYLEEILEAINPLILGEIKAIAQKALGTNNLHDEYMDYQYGRELKQAMKEIYEKVSSRLDK